MSIKLIHQYFIKIVLKLIQFYQYFISPLIPPHCRFHPSCSHYSYEVFKRFGLLRGSYLSICRICKCHPLTTPQFDPPPEK